MKPDKMAYEINSEDQEGVEFAIRLDKTVRASDGTRGVVEIEHCTTVELPLHKMKWMIDCLRDISFEVDDDEICSP